MKFITKELWRTVNYGSMRAFDRAAREWKKNDVLYRKLLQRVLPRLKPSSRAFFKQIGLLHDGTLLSFEAGDVLDFSISKSSRPRNTRARILAEASDLTVLTLNYQTVTRIAFDFPSDKPLFDYDNIGDWGYDQLTLVRPEVLRHEIVFSSGATILIESRQITVKRQAPKNR